MAVAPCEHKTAVRRPLGPINRRRARNASREPITGRYYQRKTDHRVMAKLITGDIISEKPIAG